jgi:hypothetical protein
MLQIKREIIIFTERNNSFMALFVLSAFIYSMLMTDKTLITKQNGGTEMMSCFSHRKCSKYPPLHPDITKSRYD